MGSYKLEFLTTNTSACAFVRFKRKGPFFPSGASVHAFKNVNSHMKRLLEEPIVYSVWMSQLSVKLVPLNRAEFTKNANLELHKKNLH